MKTLGNKTYKKGGGATGFHQFYEKLYTDRWQNLQSALRGESRPFELTEGYRTTYWLDEASWIAARVLPILPGHRVLDLCAAPGGKTLILAKALQGQGELWASDRSPDRIRRLKKVLDDHLFPDDRKCIQVYCRDATVWGRQKPEYFDRVLLDAPCSSERHVLASPHHLALWTPARSKNLAMQQFSLLASAFDTLAPEGLLVYSTCALSPIENDGVIDKLIQKRGDKVEIVEVQMKIGERSKHGIHILPDMSKGAGPLYYCLIRKNVEPEKEI